MVKRYKPIVWTITVFLIVLLMHLTKEGADVELAQVLTLGGLYATGMVLGVLVQPATD